MILVTGATGTVGSNVVRLLVEAKPNTKIRAMTRDPSKAKMPAGVEVVKGDYDDPASLSAAMQGVEKLFLLALGPKLADNEGRAMAAAKVAGVKHVVKISTLGAQAKASKIATWHRTGEEHVEASGISWTFLRPSGFMSNAMGWVGSIKNAGAVFGAQGTHKSAPIHPTDIAACAAKVLLSSGHENKAYGLTGGELFTVAEQVAVLSEVVGRPIRFVGLPDDKLRESMIAAGRPPALADGVVDLIRAVRENGGSPSLSDVPNLLGRPPLTWAQWCQEHAAAFR
jgi:uncharacterized protein YbjT (DUF2867 family)